MTCFGSLPSSIRETCPNHLSLLSLILSSNFYRAVFSFTYSCQTLSFQVLPIVIAKMCDVLLPTFPFVWQTEATVPHCRALLTEPPLRKSRFEFQVITFILPYWIYFSKYIIAFTHPYNDNLCRNCCQWLKWARTRRNGVPGPQEIDWNSYGPQCH